MADEVKTNDKKTLGVVIAVIVCLLLVLASGVFVYLKPQLFSGKSSVTPTPAPVSSDSEVRNLDLQLSGKDDAKLSGKVSLNNVDGKAKVVIELTNAAKDSKQSAALYQGTCDTYTDLVFELQPLSDGKSETLLTVSTQNVLDRSPLVVVVTKSLVDMTPSACVALNK